MIISYWKQKIVLLLSLLFFSLIQLPLFAWENVCPSPSVSYCSNVGKAAYSKPTKYPKRKGMRLGTITGVAWRPQGTVINVLKDTTINAPKDAYYYIISSDWDEPFLKQCDDIDVKENEQFEQEK